MRPRLLLVYAAVCALWGSTWLVVKVGLQDLPPLRFVALRMLLAAALLLPFALRGGVARLAGAEWRWLLGIGLLQVTIPYGLMFFGQTLVSSGLAAVLFSTFPVWLVLLGRLLLPGQALTARTLGLAALGLMGVVVLQAGVAGGGAGGGAAPGGPALLGAALITLGSISCALANVLVQRRRHTLSPVVLTFGQAVGAGLVLLLASAALERGQVATFTPSALGALAYLALGGTVLTYLGFYWLLARVSLVTIGTIPLVDTTVALTLGTLVAGEPVTAPLVAGAGLVLAASALSIGGERR
ncbi:MAG: DMT family transporter [Anaeromyxobacter sp.]|nr:DMT family transporter [Anaeromyxobacter sp.]MBL0276912.1 DMT family transporter [Anaeromyxobacter sp.]